MDLSQYKASEMEIVENDFSNMPNIKEGEYKFVITDAEMKETQKGDGEYLSIETRIIGGEFDGRVIFKNFNLVNPNPQAVNIAKSELKTLYQAAGIDGVESETELLGLKFMGDIKQKEYKGKPQYEIKKIRAIDGTPTPKGQVQDKQEEVQPTTNKRPWEK